MATTKKPARSTGKKSPAKAKKSTRQTKSPAKRPSTTSKSPAIKASAAKAPLQRPRVMIVPPSEPLFRAAELDGIEPKKPVLKPAPVRAPRPPAKLPIPQSTYFF